MAATNFDSLGAEKEMTYDATEGEEGYWGTFRLIGLLVLAAAFVGFVYLAYMQGVRNAMKPVPTFAAADGPYKVQPDDPGGRTFDGANQKMVYDRVAGAETSVAGAGAQATAEEPINLDMATGGPVAETDIAALDLTETPLVTNAVPAPLPRPEGITAAIDRTSTTEPFIEDDPAPQQATTSAPPADPKPTEVASIEQITQPTAAETPTSARSGAYVLQLAAFRDESAASSEWSKVHKKHSDLLVGLLPDFEVADIPGKGVYYRLRVGPFETKAEANEVCSALKARSQGCMLKSVK